MRTAHIYSDRKPETFSVPERCVVLGFEVIGPDAHSFVTAAGNRVRDAWIEKHRVRPDTELTRKSSGNGTHHKARYPLSFQSAADLIIQETAESDGAAEASQLLFDFDFSEPEPELEEPELEEPGLEEPDLFPRSLPSTRVLANSDAGGVSLAEARRIVDNALVRRESTTCLCCRLQLKVRVVKLCQATLDYAEALALGTSPPSAADTRRWFEPVVAWGLVASVGGPPDPTQCAKGPAYDGFMSKKRALPAALYYFDGRLVGTSVENTMVWQITGEEP